jgi:hypothetical protein
MMCLNCGYVIAEDGEISLYVNSEKSVSRLAKNDRHRLYLTCLHCESKNYFIKEYSPRGAFLRLSHFENHAH